MADTNLVLNLTANGADKVANALNNVANAAEKTGGSMDRMGSLGGAAMVALGNLASNLATRTASAFTSMVEGGISTAASIETNTMAIEAMTGSVTKAHQIMTQVMDEAKTSPFDTDALMDWSKKLLGAGMNADHVVTSIHTIGDAMAAFGLDTFHASNFMLAWTQMMSRGKIDLGDLNQMSNSGVSALQLFAKATGKSTGELSDMISKGKLLSKDVMPQVEKYMKSHYMGDQAKMAQTLTGAWGNLHDAVNIGIAKAIQPAEKSMKNGLAVAIGLVNKATDWLAKTGVPALMKFGGAVKTWVEDIWKKAQPTVTATVNFIRNVLIPDIGKIASFIVTYVVPNVLKLWGAFGPTALGALKTVWGGIQWGIDNLPKLGAVINGVVNYLISIKDTIKVIGVGIGSAWVAFKAWQGIQAIWGVMSGVYAAWKLATAEQTTMQWLLNVALDANPIGVVIGLIVGLAAGLVYLWNTSSGFRDFFVSAMQDLVSWTAWAAEKILSGFTWAFGWIPGLGDKLRTASGWFNQWAKDVNSDLDSLRDRTVTVTGQFAFSPSGGKNASAFGQSLFSPSGPLRIGGSTGGGGGGSIGGYGGNGYEGLSGAPPGGGGGAGGRGGGGRGGAAAKAKAEHAATTRKDVGKDLEHGSSLWKDLFKGYDQLEGALKTLGDHVRESGNKAAEAIVANGAKHLEALSRSLEKVSNRLNDARKKLDDLRQARGEVKQGVYDTVMSSGVVTDGDGTDFGSIVFRLQNAVAHARQFDTVLAQLRKNGLSPLLLKQLADAGPEKGLSYAQSLLAAGKSGITQVNNLEGQLGSAGKRLGDTVGGSMYDAGIHSAEGLVRGLEHKQKDIEKLMQKWANAMATALRKALGIHSPSKVFHEIGQFTGHGLIAGMNSTQGAVTQAASDLVSAGMGSRLPRVPSPRSGAGNGMTINIHGFVGGEQAVIRKINEMQARYGARGVNGAH